MNLDNNLLFFFSALGAFNSTFLSIYFLFFAKPNSQSNYFLGALLGVLSIRVWKSLFFYFNPELSKIYLQIGLSACFFIGPLLYLYVKSKLSTHKPSSRLSYYQLLLGLLLVVGVGYFYPYQKHVDLWGVYFYTIIDFLWLAYILRTAFLIRHTLLRLFVQNEKLTYNEIWLLSVFFGITAIWVAYYTATYTSYISGAVSLSFVFYLSGLLLYFKRRTAADVSTKKDKYANIQIEEHRVKELLEKIESILSEKELYKNPNLSLPLLAKAINIRPQLLSQLLNNNLNQRFSHYINEYRVAEAQKLLNTNPNLKIEVIAEKCGFNSNSTFYTAFKKVTNTTPAKYTQK